MQSSMRRRLVMGPTIALLLTVLSSPDVAAGPPPAALATASALLNPTAPAAWDGSIDLYRDGAFTTQKSWLWCTAAGVQIIRNIAERAEDHSGGAQRTYFNWMRRHNRYRLPEAAGVDPAGWTAGLRRFVDDRYRLVASKTFETALRSAAARLRATNLPVALAVANGGHGWILTGFSATADPAVTRRFVVTSVRIAGPLYGLQSRNGYDMPPGTSLTTAQLRRFFTPWRYAPKPMIWDGAFISIQPIPTPWADSRVATIMPSAQPTVTNRQPAAVQSAPPKVATPLPVAGSDDRLDPNGVLALAGGLAFIRGLAVIRRSVRRGERALGNRS